jgi:integrator complex subunit 1
MPWLADLVENAEASLDILPVQCLCEFLLHDQDEAEEEEENTAQKFKKKQVSTELCRLSSLFCRNPL